MHNVVLHIDTKDWSGWKEISISRSIMQVANEFTLSLTDKFTIDSTKREIVGGDECSVSIDGKTVITGHIDDDTLSYDENSHGIEVSGRDASGDLVDCSAPSFQWINRNLLQGAQALCKPYGIRVTTNVDIGKPFTKLKSDEGESVFEVIKTAAAIRGVLVMADGKGGILIGRAGTKRLSGVLELGINIKSGSSPRSMLDRFSEYTVKGQTAESFLSDTTSVSYTAKDKSIKRYRPKIILADDAVDIASCKTLAVWHRNVAAAKSKPVNYVVQGWYLNDQLIEPDYLVHVKDHFLKINHDLLITAVNYIVDDQGLRAELSLSEPEALTLTELPEPSDDDEDTL